MKGLLLTAVLGLVSLSAVSEQMDYIAEEDEIEEMRDEDQRKECEMDLELEKSYDVCFCR